MFRLVTHDRAFRHHIVSLTGMEQYGQPLIDAGIAVTTLNLPRGKLQLGAMGRLLRLLRTERPSAVQTWMYHSDLIGGVLARLAGCRNVLWNIRHSSLDPAHNSRKTIALAKVCAKLSSAIPRQIVCCGKAALNAHVDLGYDARRMLVIQNGYDLSHLYPDSQAGLALRHEIGLSAGDLLLGMVGRFASEKDHANLFAALAEVAASGLDFSLILAGGGLDRDNSTLAAMLAQHGLESRTCLLGPRSDIRAVMSALDLHILSSRSEGFPNVVAEAMACGTVVVSTRAGDAAEIVGDTGWIVPVSSPRELAAAIKEAASERLDDPLWQLRRAAARSHIAANFELDRMVERYVELWKNTL